MLHFIVEGIQVWIPGLVLFGVCIGFLSGFFGVGGGFLITPLLNILFGIPYPVAVGSDVAQMVGTSAAGASRHIKLKNVDYKLGLVMLCFTLPGVELGKNLLVYLKDLGSITRGARAVPIVSIVMNSLFTVLLITTGIFILFDSLRKIRATPESDEEKTRIAQKLHSFKLKPTISFPGCGVESISIWIIAGLSFSIGLLIGLLGVGGGFILVPVFIYLIGIPTNMAIGTSLFFIMFSSLFAATRHYQIGNVSFPLVFGILAGSIIGSQFGAITTKKVRGARIRLYFSFIILCAGTITMWKLATLLGIF